MKTKHVALRAFAPSFIAITAFALSCIATVSVAETLIPKSADMKKPVQIHVSPQGNDENDGSAAKPVASLQIAQLLARTVRGTTVVIHGGTYRLERRLEFTHADEGVEFCAAPGEKVVVTSDRKTPVGKPQGGGFGPTVQPDDGTLVTSCSYSGEDEKSYLEVVQWKLQEFAVP